MSEKLKSVAVKIKISDYEKLRNIARKEGKTESEILRRAIQRFVNLPSLQIKLGLAKDTGQGIEWLQEPYEPTRTNELMKKGRPKGRASSKIKYINK